MSFNGVRRTPTCPRGHANSTACSQPSQMPSLLGMSLFAACRYAKQPDSYSTRSASRPDHRRNSIHNPPPCQTAPHYHPNCTSPQSRLDSPHQPNLPWKADKQPCRFLSESSTRMAISSKTRPGSGTTCRSPTTASLWTTSPTLRAALATAAPSPTAPSPTPPSGAGWAASVRRATPSPTTGSTPWAGAAWR